MWAPDGVVVVGADHRRSCVRVEFTTDSLPTAERAAPQSAHPVRSEPPGSPPSCAGHLAGVHEELFAEQQVTLETPRRRYGFSARTLFVTMDALHGRRASLRKFAVLALVARVPYQTWEHAVYMAITRHAGEVLIARAIHERVCREDHAEHEYMAFVATIPSLERSGCARTIAPDYGTSGSIADVRRRIGLDEREHKQESLDELAGLEPRPHRRWRAAVVASALTAALGAVRLGT